MALSIKADVEGLGDVFKRLQKVRASVQRRLLKKAMQAATKPVLAAAKANAPRESGLYKKSLGRKVIAYRQGGTVVGLIGPRSSKTTVNKATGKKTRTPSFRRQVTLKAGKGKGARRITVVRNPVHYAHLVERGRRAVTVKKKKVLSSGLQILGRSVAAAAGRRPLGRAWDSQRGAATEIMRRVIADGIVAELSKG